MARGESVVAVIDIAPESTISFESAVRPRSAYGCYDPIVEPHVS